MQWKNISLGCGSFPSCCLGHSILFSSAVPSQWRAKKQHLYCLSLKRIQWKAMSKLNILSFCIFEEFFEWRISLEEKNLFSSTAIIRSWCGIPKPMQFKLLVSNSLVLLYFQGAFYMYVDTVKDNTLCFHSFLASNLGT